MIPELQRINARLADLENQVATQHLFDSRTVAIKRIPRRGTSVEVKPQTISAPGGSSVEEMVIVSAQGDFLVCKPFEYASTGKPSSVSLGEEILVAKQYPFRITTWNSTTPYPGITPYESGVGEYFVSAISNQRRSIYSRVSSTDTFIRDEHVWPPYTTYTPGSAAFTYGTIIPVTDVGENIMEVSYNGFQRQISRIEVMARAWMPESSGATVQQFQIVGIGSIGAGHISAKRVLAQDTNGLPTSISPASEDVIVPHVFRGTGGTWNLPGGYGYGYPDPGMRRTASTTVNTLQSEWQEWVTPQYEIGQIIVVATMPDGKLIDLGVGRSWQMPTATHWYCTEEVDTRITLRGTPVYNFT